MSTQAVDPCPCRRKRRVNRHASAYAPRTTSQTKDKITQLTLRPMAWATLCQPFQSQRSAGGNVTSEECVDERRERRRLSEDKEETQEHQDEEEGEHPPLLAQEHEVPEFTEDGESTHGLRIANSHWPRKGVGPPLLLG